MTMHGFERVDQRHITALDIDFQSYVHLATGARHYHLACADTNNAFMVAFPTIPTDSTGVAHMLEHTTLCGSKTFPVRDPFFMMLRRSLNTFMNAFTSGDSTAYPFATQNRKDFSNLLSVYLDAVFFPTLDPLDFAQEGWRLEFTSEEDSNLEFKGVVYNEMKGAMSAPSSQLWEHLHHAIFRDTVYRFNSGGDPAHIPDLSYADLKAFHARHYHPTQSIFMTYGSFAVEEHQAQFEANALVHFDKNKEEISVDLQRRLTGPFRFENKYSVPDVNDSSRGTHAVWGWLLGLSADPKCLLEGHLLSSALLEHGASPLRQLLETTPLADAPSELCGLDDSGQQLVFCCGVEGTERQHVAEIEQALLTLLHKLAEDGVDHQTLEGILDRMEMAQRDIGGGYPYGLQLMGRALPGALYGHDPVALIDIDDELVRLRERISDPAYIRQLFREQLLDNMHRVCTIMCPDASKQEADRTAELARLADTLAGMDGDQRRAIRADSAQLLARQDEPQNADLLPKVTLEDVPRTLSGIEGERRTLAGTAAHCFVVPSNGILHAQLVIDLPHLTEAELLQLPLFCEYLTELGCNGEDYLQTQARRALVGSIGAYASARTQVDDINALNSRLVLTVKGLQRKREELIENLFEILSGVRCDESARLRDLLAQSRVDVESSITDRGHQLAMQGAARSLSVGARLDDLWEGPANIMLVQRVERDCRNDDAALSALAASFERLRTKILGAPWRVLLVGEEAILSDTMTQLRGTADLPVSSSKFQPLNVPSQPSAIDCAWLTNTQVNFCARAYPAIVEGHNDAAALSVLAKYLTDGYLHPAIREKGGAYGAGAQFDIDSATFRFFSYRDPRLIDTLADFDGALPWLSKSHDTQRLEESILGVIRQLDSPRPPAGSAIREFYHDLDGRTLSFRQSFRDRVLNTSMDDVATAAAHYLVAQSPATAVISSDAHRRDFEQLHLEVVQL